MAAPVTRRQAWAIAVVCLVLAVQLFVSRCSTVHTQVCQKDERATPKPVQPTSTTAGTTSKEAQDTGNHWDCQRQRASVVPKVACRHSPYFLSHFPISGGTSLHYTLVQAIRLALGHEPIACPGNYIADSMRVGNAAASGFCPDHAFLDEDNRKQLASDVTQWDQCHYVTSHDSASVFLALPCNNFRSIALLRHPLQHRWSMWHKRWHVSPERHDGNFTAWLMSAPLASTYQMHFYADILATFPQTYLHPEDIKGLRIDRDLALRVAKSNLDRFVVVGTLERLADTIKALARELRLDDAATEQLLQASKAHRIHHNPNKGEMPLEVQRNDFVERVLHHEMELYRYANKRLDQALGVSSTN